MIGKIKYFFIIAIGFVCLASGIFPFGAPRLDAAQNSPAMQAYFTPSKDCENNIILRINEAKKIDIAVYSITNRAIARAILAARARGAKIRMVTDRLQAAGKGSLVGQLRAAGLPVRTNIKHKIEHNKFAVFDDAQVVSGSYNWTSAASDKNSENCVFFAQPDDKPFSERFQYLWDLYGGGQ
jgi:phosphatidylserine/phosphatidylglycerophosphate/cardiolipin synthase-like enzyme